MKMASRGLALSDSQITDLRVVVALLPSDQLRGQFSEMLSAALRNRDSVGEGELARLSRQLVGELLQRHERQHVRPRPQQPETDVIRGYGVTP
jgi:hypothetical protein